jgi:probable phosphoglycerate mutase
MTILLLIRHASNDCVKEGRLAGLTPGVHLNAQGQREAADLARRLNHVSLHAIYASPLDRTRETAQAIAQCQKLDVQICDGLIEVDVGEWTGKLIKDLEPTDAWRQLIAQPNAFRFPGGDSIPQVQTRIVAAIDAIVAAHPDQVVAVVSHADPIKLALAHYLAMDVSQFNRIVINPASVSVLMFGARGAALYRLNDAGALPTFKPEKPTDDRRKEEQKMAEANILYDLNPVSHITVGAIGEPGKRTFFVQGQQGTSVVTLVSEKDQVIALSRGIDEILERLGISGQAVSMSEEEMELVEPIDPVFRVGQLGLGYDQASKLLVLVAYELPEEENPATVNVVRFWATGEQMRKLARHAAVIVAAGRPVCVLCGRPIDPEGHFCPKRNGHGEKAILT